MHSFFAVRCGGTSKCGGGQRRRRRSVCVCGTFGSWASMRIYLFQSLYDRFFSSVISARPRSRRIFLVKEVAVMVEVIGLDSLE